MLSSFLTPADTTKGESDAQDELFRKAVYNKVLLEEPDINDIIQSIAEKGRWARFVKEAYTRYIANENKAKDEEPNFKVSAMHLIIPPEIMSSIVQGTRAQKDKAAEDFLRFALNSDPIYSSLNRQRDAATTTAEKGLIAKKALDERRAFFKRNSDIGTAALLFGKTARVARALQEANGRLWRSSSLKRESVKQLGPPAKKQKITDQPAEPIPPPKKFIQLKPPPQPKGKKVAKKVIKETQEQETTADAYVQGLYDFWKEQDQYETLSGWMLTSFPFDLGRVTNIQKATWTKVAEDMRDMIMTVDDDLILYDMYSRFMKAYPRKVTPQQVEKAVKEDFSRYADGVISDMFLDYSGAVYDDLKTKYEVRIAKIASGEIDGIQFGTIKELVNDLGDELHSIQTGEIQVPEPAETEAHISEEEETIEDEEMQARAVEEDQINNLKQSLKKGTVIKKYIDPADGFAVKVAWTRTTPHLPRFFKVVKSSDRMEWPLKLIMREPGLISSSTSRVSTKVR